MNTHACMMNVIKDHLCKYQVNVNLVPIIKSKLIQRLVLCLHVAQTKSYNKMDNVLNAPIIHIRMININVLLTFVIISLLFSWTENVRVAHNTHTNKINIIVNLMSVIHPKFF